jgi:hypothetical protein
LSEVRSIFLLSKEVSLAASVTQRPEVSGVPSQKPARYCPSLPEIGVKIRRAVVSLWTLAILGLALLTVLVAYQFRPAYDIELGGGFDTPYLNLKEGGFGNPVGQPAEESETSRTAPVTPAPGGKATAPEEVADSYRWTRERPILLLPGIGAQPLRLTLTATGSPLYPDGQRVAMLLNGKPYNEFTLKPGVPVKIQYDFGAEWAGGGNLAVEMRVTPLGKPKQELIGQFPGTFIPIDKKGDTYIYQGETGFKLYEARVESAPGASGFVMPPVGTLLAFVAIAVLFYLGLAYAGVPGKWAFGAAAVLTLAGGLLLAVYRLGFTVATGRLALLMALIVVALPMLDWLVPRLFRKWALPLPQWAWQVLLVMFLLGMFGKGGGVMYPHMEVIDAPYHVRETLRVLENPGKQWFNKDLSKVPDQWESSAIIPYSTVTYFVQAPLALIPVDPYLTINLFNILLDATRVFVIYALAVALGAGVVPALVAVGLYLIIPSNWLLVSWGNWPTTMSLWLGIVYLLLVVVNWQRFRQPSVFAFATATLTLTMMMYSVTAVFMGMLLYGWAFGLVVFNRKDKNARQNGVALFASATLAAVIAVVLYYFQFLPDLATTLNSFNSSLESKGSLGGFGDRTLDFYLGLYLRDVFFRYQAGIIITIALIVWAWLLFTKRQTPGDVFAIESNEPNVAALRYPAWLWLAGVWFAVFMLFGLAQWKVDMVNKQVWFVIPLAVIYAGVGLVWLWQRYKTPTMLYGSRLAIAALVGWTLYGALALWIYRVFIKRR